MQTGITIYDGASCIGGNKIYVDNGAAGVFLDFGKNFGKYSVYYEEFLKNRTTRGLHDLLHLGLIPCLDIYRRDLIPGDIDTTQFPRLNVGAILLSHAHLDHAGNIGLLDLKVPVIASPMSIAILKGLQDTGRSDTEGDVVYTTERRPSRDDPLYLESSGDTYRGRSFLCTCPVTSTFVDFLGWRAGQEGRSRKIEPGSCHAVDCSRLPFSLETFAVDHSIPGACGFVLRGDTAVAYTGDFRLHGGGGENTRSFAAGAKDASILITEGTRVTEPCGKRITEESVCAQCRDTVETSPGLVIADFSARNFERLCAFRDIAAHAGRELVVTARDLYMLWAIQHADGLERWRGLSVYDEITNHTKRKWETEIVKSCAENRYVTGEEIRTNPDHFLLCFSFFDMNHLLDIRPEGGRYIYSSCEPFSEEMEMDFRRLAQWLTFFHIEPCGFSLKTNEAGVTEPVMQPGYHASGHAAGEDVLWIIDRIDPDVIIPVHTESPQWFAEHCENVLLPEEGKRYTF